MRILLLQDGDELVDRVHFLLESTYGAEVAEAKTVDDSIAALSKENAKFDLIVYDLLGAGPDELQKILMANSANPFLLCVPGKPEGQDLLDPSIVGAIDRTNLAQNLTQAIDGLIEAGKIPKPVTDTNYCRIRTKLLLAVCPLKNDIYIRLSEWKFVKLFREGDVFDLADMEKYTVKKGVEYLYLRKEDSGEFVQKYSKELQRLLASSPLSVEAVSRSSETAHETIRELGARLGFTREVQELAKTQVQLTMKSVGRSPRLNDMINKMKNAKGEYIAAHSTMAAYLSCAIASQMQWGSDLTFFKLNLAAFLHDITLHNQDLAACESLEDLEREPGRFTAAEIQEFKNHPMASGQVARQFSEVPPDVDTIIMQHHERPDGTGFPRGLAATYIAPLTAVFIVAHDLTRFVLEKGPYFDMSAFIVGVKDKYKASQFRKVLTAMEML